MVEKWLAFATAHLEVSSVILTSELILHGNSLCATRGCVMQTGDHVTFRVHFNWRYERNYVVQTAGRVHFSCTFQRAVLAALCGTDGGSCSLFVHISTCGASGSVWYRRRVVSLFVYISTCGTSGSVWYRRQVVSLFVYISTCDTSGSVWYRRRVVSLFVYQLPGRMYLFSAVIRLFCSDMSLFGASSACFNNRTVRGHL